MSILLGPTESPRVGAQNPGEVLYLHIALYSTYKCTAIIELMYYNDATNFNLHNWLIIIIISIEGTHINTSYDKYKTAEYTACHILRVYILSFIYLYTLNETSPWHRKLN